MTILWEGAERALDDSEQRVTYQFISEKLPPFPTSQKARADCHEHSLSGIQGAMTLHWESH